MVRPRFTSKARPVLGCVFAHMATRMVLVWGARDVGRELVSIRSQKSRNRPPERGKAGRVVGITVNNGRDIWATGVQIQAVRQIDAGVRPVSRLELAGVEVSRNQQSGSDLFVINSTGLNHPNPAVTIDAASIPAMHAHQPSPTNSRFACWQVFLP